MTGSLRVAFLELVREWLLFLVNKMPVGDGIRLVYCLRVELLFGTYYLNHK